MTFRITILPNKTFTSTLRRASTLRRTEIRKTHMKGITHSEPASLAKHPTHQFSITKLGKLLYTGKEKAHKKNANVCNDTRSHRQKGVPKRC